MVVDGPAGSGKTTFASRLAAAAGDVQVLHMDDFYEGWSGGLTPDVWERLHEQVLQPLSQGADGLYAHYDWTLGEFAEHRPVPLRPLLVLEGVGAAARPVEPYASLRVWVEAPVELRLRRGLERDGEAMRAHWLRWLDREAAHFRADGTRARADVLVDGRGTADGDPTTYTVV